MVNRHRDLLIVGQAWGMVVHEAGLVATAFNEPSEVRRGRAFGT